MNSIPANPAWGSAAGYTERLQTMIRETVALLGDVSANASYELTGIELATTIRERNLPIAEEKGVVLEVGPGFATQIDSHKGASSAWSQATWCRMRSLRLAEARWSSSRWSTQVGQWS